MGSLLIVFIVELNVERGIFERVSLVQITIIIELNQQYEAVLTLLNASRKFCKRNFWSLRFAICESESHLHEKALMDLYDIQLRTKLKYF